MTAGLGEKSSSLKYSSKLLFGDDECVVSLRYEYLGSLLLGVVAFVMVLTKL